MNSLECTSGVTQGLFYRLDERKLPNEALINIFLYFSRSELGILTCVSWEWRDLALSDPVWRYQLNRVKATVEALITHPRTPEFRIFNSNDIFKLSLPEANESESIYQCMTRNRVDVNGENPIEVLEHVVSSCELGIPKLHIYKSLKDSFTVALVILFGNAQKHEPTDAQISFLSSSEAGWSNWDMEKSPIFPNVSGFSGGVHNGNASWHLHQWYEPVRYCISSFARAFESKMWKLCAKRIAVLTASTTQQASTFNAENASSL